MQDYFIYLPLPEGRPLWDVVVTGAGFTHIPPGGTYPPEQFHHPSDHMFTWDKGRVLKMWQVLLIHKGTGWFESRPTGRQRCQAGSVFILFPGVWHRYKPDPKIGWTDSYLELTGPLPDRLRDQGRLRPENAVFHFGAQPELTAGFDSIHLLAQNRPVGYAGQLAAAAMQILALILSLAETANGAPRRVHEIVRRAQTLLTERYDQPLRVGQLARELGIGPSYFRRVFQQHTGLSPKKYAVHLRFRRAQTLLHTTSLTIKEIADRLNYHSPGHLSAEFKRRTGQAPSACRKKPLRR